MFELIGGDSCQKFWQNVIVQFFSYLNQYMWDVSQTTMMNILKSKI